VSEQLFVNGSYFPDTWITLAQDKFKAWFLQALHMVEARMIQSLRIAITYFRHFPFP